ncbi:MAG: sigma-70 family RNA polymerase sigma factor [Phycisphaerae bacterium]|nr:sigma-70 family RNA polymerase sigma factor [Phycisphaerae bacterium]
MESKFDNINGPNGHKRFFELFLNAQPRIYGFLYVMIHNRADVEDILQETVTGMWENFDKYQEGTDFSAWGIAIARNKAINFIKKNSRSRPQLSEDVYKMIAEHEAQGKTDYTEHAEALEQCSRELSERDQKILSLRYKEEISMKKIAQMLGRSSTGIYHTMARIHTVLQECIRRTLDLKQG